MVHEIERDLRRIRYPSLRGCISDFERHSCSLPNLKRVVARNVERLQTVTHDETPRSLGIRTEGPGENPAVTDEGARFAAVSRMDAIRSEVESFRMGRKLNELFREASQLTERERAELAALLLESLEGEPDEDVEAAWVEEIERRVRQIDSGEVETIPWEQVRAELYARLNDKR